VLLGRNRGISLVLGSARSKGCLFLGGASVLLFL
jgi:hypothetical protein